MNLFELTIEQAAEKLAKKEISSVDLTKTFLERIKTEDKQIHAYLTVTEEQALEAAHESDERRAKGEGRGSLDGIPIAVKDNIATQGIRTTAGSKILENFIPPYDAHVVSRLKSAGAVILGKTNMDEFAFGSSTENSAFGPTKNPHDLERVPGGSSGGSAAAVAANFCAGALGSDTGGSIRQPASFCGVVGLKPTYGRVSRNGLIAFGSSLDQIGPLTKTVGDAVLLYSAIAGKDPNDSTSVEMKIADPEKIDLKKIRIGLPKEFIGEGLESGVREKVMDAVTALVDLGAQIIDVTLPHMEYALASYYIVAMAEASSNLLRFDGIKYGYSVAKEEGRSKNGLDLFDVYMKTRGEGFGAEVKRRIMLGTFVLSAGYFDAYYKQAQKIRRLLAEDFDKVFNDVDIILGPVSPTTAFKLGEKVNDPLLMYLSDVLTVPVNLCGLPGISVPVGNADSLPVGLQIIGPMYSEAKILGVAREVEKL